MRFSMYLDHYNIAVNKFDFCVIATLYEGIVSIAEIAVASSKQYQPLLSSFPCDSRLVVIISVSTTISYYYRTVKGVL